MKHLLAALLLFSFTRIHAQWETHGPYGGPVNAMASEDTITFAGTGNGVFRKGGAADSWTAAGLTGIHVTSLAAGNGWFAGTTDSGIFSSPDNGTSWIPRNAGLPSLSITALYADSSIVYAATSAGIMFSNDAGASWSGANAGIPASYPAYCFAGSGDTLFAGTYGQGLYVSYNHSFFWTPVTAIPSGTFVYSLFLEGNLLLAGTSDGIYRSADGGISWSPANTGIPAMTWASALGSSGTALWAGTYSEGTFVSADNGLTWSAASSGLPDPPFVTGLPHNYPPVRALTRDAAQLLVATSDGVYQHDGTSWNDRSAGILANPMTTVSAGITGVFAGGEQTGMYQGDETEWQRISVNLPSWMVLASAVLPSGDVLASVENGGLFRRTTGAGTWTSAGGGLPADPASIVADSSQVLVITQGGPGTPSAVFRSTDDGINFSPLTSAPSFPSVIAAQGSTLFLAVNGGALFRSNDNGISWSPADAGLPGTTITALSISGSFIHAGNYNGQVFSSTDGGATWTAASGLPSSSITDIIEVAGTLYAATLDSGVYSSDISGLSWTPYSINLFDRRVRQLAADDLYLYAATASGVYSSLLAPVGTADRLPLLQFSVSPVPSAGVVTIRGLERSALVEVISVNGAVVQRFHAASPTLDLHLRDKGTYVVRVTGKCGQGARKILIE